MNLENGSNNFHDILYAGGLGPSSDFGFVFGKSTKNKITVIPVLYTNKKQKTK